MHRCNFLSAWFAAIRRSYVTGWRWPRAPPSLSLTSITKLYIYNGSGLMRFVASVHAGHRKREMRLSGDGQEISNNWTKAKQGLWRNDYLSLGIVFAEWQTCKLNCPPLICRRINGTQSEDSGKRTTTARTKELRTEPPPLSPPTLHTHTHTPTRPPTTNNKLIRPREHLLTAC